MNACIPSGNRAWSPSTLPVASSRTPQQSSTARAHATCQSRVYVERGSVRRDMHVAARGGPDGSEWSRAKTVCDCTYSVMTRLTVDVVVAEALQAGGLELACDREYLRARAPVDAAGHGGAPGVPAHDRLSAELGARPGLTAGRQQQQQKQRQQW
eukprot:SAG22_NODE_2355_length_2672_cov_1.682472_1_plen_155_part_00